MALYSETIFGQWKEESEQQMKEKKKRRRTKYVVIEKKNNSETVHDWTAIPLLFINSKWLLGI